MKEMQVFKNSEFGELGVLEIDGKPYFPATACAKILGYVNPRDAIKRHCKIEGVVKRDAWVQTGTKSDGTPAMRQNSTNYIDEGNLYRLIVNSKLPAAERFETWVFDEVLPTIRRKGAYVPNLNEAISKTATAVVMEVMRQLIPIIKDALDHRTRQSYCGPDATGLCDLSNRCKLETFPPDVVGQVDAMLEEMLQQQSLNFSLIARYCTVNGYAISSPSVKTYFKRRFGQN